MDQTDNLPGIKVTVVLFLLDAEIIDLLANEKSPCTLRVNIFDNYNIEL